MWFNPRALQTQQHTPGDSCDFGDFSSYMPLKVARVAKVATPSLLKSEERDVILAWLDSIGEINAESIARLIRQCQDDLEERKYFLALAIADRIANTDHLDDRRFCHQCTNLSFTGSCLAAKRGEIKTARDYSPMTDFPLRCAGYEPKPDDLDQRSGKERWSGSFKQPKLPIGENP